MMIQPNGAGNVIVINPNNGHPIGVGNRDSSGNIYVQPLNPGEVRRDNE